MGYIGDSDEGRIISLLNKTNKIIRNEMVKSSQKYGFTAPQLMMIKYVGENQPVKLTDVATEMGLSMSTTSGIVDRLVVQGVLKRERSKTDRRSVYLTITQKTKEYAEQLHLGVELFLKNIFLKVSKDEKQQMIESLEKLYDILTTACEKDK